MQEVQLTDILLCPRCEGCAVFLGGVGGEGRLVVHTNAQEWSIIAMATGKPETLPPPILPALRTLLGTFDACPERVVLEERDEKGFVGHIYLLQGVDGEERTVVEVSAGDAIAMALHLAIPLFAREDLLTLEPSDAEVKRWLETLNPQDFEKASGFAE